MFVFDESPNTLFTRCTGLGVKLEEHNESGAVRIVQIDPAELSPGEFAFQIRKAVEEWGASFVVIDSLNGYLNAMPEERFLTIQLHELLMFLSQKGVATLLIAAHQGVIASQMTDADRCQLPRRCGRVVALLRGARRGAAGHLGSQETRRPARAHDPGVCDGPGRHQSRRDPP